MVFWARVSSTLFLRWPFGGQACWCLGIVPLIVCTSDEEVSFRIAMSVELGIPTAEETLIGKFREANLSDVGQGAYLSVGHLKGVRHFSIAFYLALYTD